MEILVQNISKRFKEFVALDDVSLPIKSGELIALLGPSGSGKTTLLRIIAGLEFADSGTIILNGADANQQSVKERNVGFVFQHYALFRHMTVFENVAFGLRVRPKETRPSKAVIREKVMNLLQMVHLDMFHDRYPSQLSGGQRQRVALARALAVEPTVLLLDEPFGALDAKVRKELRHWMRKLHDEMHITSIFVTHDQEEAMEVADRLVVMSNGRIEQVGTPAEVYHTPANSFVYDFLGNYNEFVGIKDETGTIHLGDVDVEKAPNTGQLAQNGWLHRHPEIEKIIAKVMRGKPAAQTTPPVAVNESAKKQRVGQKVQLFARPHEMLVTKTPDAQEYIIARVMHINPAGALVKIDLERANGSSLQAEIPKATLDELNLKKFDTVFVRPKEIKIFG
jgi:sulfate transport system ATP-binding protein